MNILCCITLLLALTSATAGVGQGVVINELQCAGEGPDRVELLNTGQQPVDIAGLRFNLDERTAVLEKHLLLRGGECLVITFGKTPVEVGQHVPFGLPRSGGTLLLVSSDGLGILDACTWPAMPADLSIGRQPDGGSGWSFFPTPGFGAPNASAPALRAIAAAPWAEVPPGTVLLGTAITLKCEAGNRIRYTTDGSEPGLKHGADGNTPLVITRNTVVKAKAFALDVLPSATFTASYFLSPPPGQVVSLNIFTGAWNGVRTAGSLELFDGDPPLQCPVRVRESGSGSRSLPKRNLKLDVYGNGSLPWPKAGNGDEVLLRADATPHAFLRNLFMECVAQQAGAHVDVQASQPMDLHFNGRYHGLYRWMPPKDEDWLRTVHGHEALDVLHGPSLRKVDGDRTHFHAAYEALLSGQPMDSLHALIDVASLIDLACFDLWTGRGDHDLNVRCWRPKVPGGTWRWILYDMDLWAPAADNSLARMCGEATPVAPYLPQLLHEASLRDRFLARMSALIATLLSPAQAQVLTDSLYNAHSDAMLRDHERWSPEMQMPTPDEAQGALLDFTAQRPEHVLQQLSARTGMRLRNMDVAVSPSSGGSIQVEDLQLLALPARFMAFAGAPLHVLAVPAEGYEFVEWKEAKGDAAIIIVPPNSRTRKSQKLTAVFRRTNGPDVPGSSHHGLQQSGEERFAIGVP